MQQTTWTPVYFIAKLFYFIALVRTAFEWIHHRLNDRMWKWLITAQLY